MRRGALEHSTPHLPRQEQLQVAVFVAKDVYKSKFLLGRGPNFAVVAHALRANGFPDLSSFTSRALQSRPAAPCARHAQGTLLSVSKFQLRGWRRNPKSSAEPRNLSEVLPGLLSHRDRTRAEAHGCELNCIGGHPASCLVGEFWRCVVVIHVRAKESKASVKARSCGPASRCQN